MGRRLYITLVLALSIVYQVKGSDTLQISARQRKPFLQRLCACVGDIVRDFTAVDTAYVMPQAYNYTVMLQNTDTYEIYDFTDREDNQISFAPMPTIKCGPYVGWSFLFLGYTIDLFHLNGKGKKEWDLSLYSSKLAVDLFYRKTGNNYHIREVKYNGIPNFTLKDIPFDGFNGSIIGLNLYYILNNKKFSYPAAFSQSTLQKKSAGSVLFGAGYTKHKLALDVQNLGQVLQNNLPKTSKSAVSYPDMSLFDRLTYSDFTLSGGYAYNWVFAPYWIMAASVSLGISYQMRHRSGETLMEHTSAFRLKDLQCSGTSRLGIVYNNMRWYAGLSTIIHSYNHRDNQLRINNSFGNLNLYIGFNFGRK